ncbi:MAG: Histidinol dehydrogenase [candidate division WS2 bacterium]|nr:Histidinol dehydrogenase [Candidatus Psychracetigena formicireducens]
MNILLKNINDLTCEERGKIFARKATKPLEEVLKDVREIIERVRKYGDREIIENSYDYAGFNLREDEFTLKVSSEEFEKAYSKVDKNTIKALEDSYGNIEYFHLQQVQSFQQDWFVQIREGIFAGQKMRPIESVGAYVPGGRASYPSTVLMNIVPAKIAGVDKIIVFTPPNDNLEANPCVLVAADICGVHEIYKIGGPWAIGAAAYGTRTVPQVRKIVGPGNKYVMAAKLLVYGDVDIDCPAGPSEVLIIADENQDPIYVIADLVAQAEHDPDSSVILLTTSQDLAFEVKNKLDAYIESMTRKEIIRKSLSENGAILIFEDLNQAVEFSNEFAPEHLEIMTTEPLDLFSKAKNGGSIHLGRYSPVPAGDYASGTNHVLPTGGSAKSFSGLSVSSFMKNVTFQYLTKRGLESVKETIAILAKEEGLDAHASSVEVRFG